MIPASQAVPANHLEKALFSVTLLAVGTEYSCQPPSHHITADNPQHHSLSSSHTPESSIAEFSMSQHFQQCPGPGKEPPHGLRHTPTLTQQEHW